MIIDFFHEHHLESFFPHSPLQCLEYCEIIRLILILRNKLKNPSYFSDFKVLNISSYLSFLCLFIL